MKSSSSEPSVRLTEYNIQLPVVHSFSLALVTDLHEHNPAGVLEQLIKAKPDLICIAGDTFERSNYGHNPKEHRPDQFFQRMIILTAGNLDRLFFRLMGSSKDTRTSFAYELLKKAPHSNPPSSDIPVVMSLGNHEWFLTKDDQKILHENHIRLLDNSDITLTVKGTDIHLGGLSSDPDWKWYQQFEKKDGLKILLCHHPEYYPRCMKDTSVDLILSGHAHGGQIRIGKYGLFAPGQGLFPRYIHGIYDHKLIISSGCSNTASIPRLGNPCEIVVLHIHNANAKT